DGAAFHGKNGTAAVGERPALVTDDTQPKRHGSPTQDPVRRYGDCRMRRRRSSVPGAPGHIMPVSKLPERAAPSMAASHIFRIMFVNQGKVYEVYARKVSHGELFGFIEVEELVFGERSSVVLDPSEERIKGEFSGVKRTFLPLHSILRIDEVRKQGTAKITALEAGANVTQFPVPMYSAPGGE